jgi:hypothetical protein
MDLTITEARGAPRLSATLTLTSRYAWLYGGIMDGTQLYNVPANADQFGRPGESKGPTHLYDEIQLKLKESLHPGDSVKLTKAANDLGPITIDFIELEGPETGSISVAGFALAQGGRFAPSAFTVSFGGQADVTCARRKRRG